MKSAASALVKRLLESDDDSFDFDMKELYVDEPTSWEQIGGDFGDPWIYGGTWQNSTTNELWHFQGMETLEQLGIKEVEPDNVPVPSTLKAYLDRKYPLDYADPDGDMEWQERERRDNESERERAISSYQYERACFLNRRMAVPFYKIDIGDDTELPSWMDSYVKTECDSTGMSEEEFRQMPLAGQYEHIIQVTSVEEFGNQFEMTRKQARKELGCKI